MSAAEDGAKFVSRGGLKLDHALREFGVDVHGLRCADFGCNVGGFTDCLLQRGASHVTAVDTGYGALAWKLRQDPRVRVMERTSALHAPAPAGADRFDLVVIDMGWTPQRLCVPAAAAWLKPEGRIITLIKPHYELHADEKGLLDHGILPGHESERIAQRTLAELAESGVGVVASTRSPIVGGASKRHAGGAGNAEWLALLAPRQG